MPQLSRAFVKEDDLQGHEFVPPRAPLPDGEPNLVTPRGWRLLEEEHAQLEAERARRLPTGASMRALDERLAALTERIARARPVAYDGCSGRVAFGASVEFERLGSGRAVRQRVSIVGVDEADPASGRVAFVSPIARALIGARVGDEVSLGRDGTRVRVLAIGRADA